MVEGPAPGSEIPAGVGTRAKKAVRERRELDVVETAEMQIAAEEMWAKLPDDYQWLKEWKYV